MAVVEQDYQMLRNGASLVDVSAWTVLSLSGPDTASFLQGLATQDLGQIPDGRALETLFLNEKGRPVALAWISSASGGQRAWVLADECARATLPAHLTRFRIMEDVEITGNESTPRLLAFAGPQRDRLLRAVSESIEGAVTIASSPLSFLLTDREVSVADLPIIPPLCPADPAAVEAWRLAEGLPRTGVDFDLDRIATELSRPEAISTTKGCYVGQEVVARTSGRGRVRRFRAGFRFTLDGESIPARTEIRKGETGPAVGFVTSSAPEPGTGDGLAMGYVSSDLEDFEGLTGGLPQGMVSLRQGAWPL